MSFPENFRFCQLCGKTTHLAVRIDGLTVGAECVDAARTLPDAPDQAVSSDGRLARIGGQWVGRYCARCRAFCPAGVNADGFCSEYSRENGPDVTIAGGSRRNRWLTAASR